MIYPVDLLGRDRTVVPAIFAPRLIADGSGSRVELTATWAGGSTRVAAADAFEALIALRLEFAALGLTPLCWGASLHVYPSTASRRQEGGTTAYRLTLGRLPSDADRVQIFEAGPGLVAATVAEQEDFSRAWFDSLADSC